MYGIPNMKLDKSVVSRRTELMAELGIEFRLNTDAADRAVAAGLAEEFDAVVVAAGACAARGVRAEGFEEGLASGDVVYAVDYLTEQTRALLEGWCAGYERADYYNWAIVCGGRPVGGLAGIRLNERHESVELGYCLGYDWWSRGLMSEAVCAVRDFFFAEVGVHRIEILHAPQNPASGRVAQKCGLTLEGTARAYFKSAAGEFLDIRTYSILREEFERARKGD